MGKAKQSPKQSTGKRRNDERPNGKAWKQRPKQPRVLTEEERVARRIDRAVQAAAREATWRAHNVGTSDGTDTATTADNAPAKAARSSSRKAKGRGRR